MSNDNPFTPPVGAELPGGANTGDRLDPAPLEAGAVLARCWELLQRSPGVVLGSVFIPVVPQMTGSIGVAVLDAILQESPGDEELYVLVPLRIGIQVVTGLVGLWLTLGQCRIYTRLARGLDAELLMLFGEGGRMPSAFVVSFLMTLGIMAGLCLLLVPGLVLAIGWSFALYALIDRDLGPIDAISESWRLTDGHKGEVFLVSFLLSIAALLGTCLTLGLGFVLLMPLLTLAQGVMYHSLMHAQREPVR
jgi:hypothetical protein